MENTEEITVGIEELMDVVRDMTMVMVIIRMGIEIIEEIFHKI